jgi:hypothetical protein
LGWLTSTACSPPCVLRARPLAFRSKFEDLTRVVGWKRAAAQFLKSTKTLIGTLAEAVSLDMVGHWQPTATNYLGQVTKAVIVEAVREGVSEQAAKQLADLKKPAMAEAAERLLADKGWLPQVLRLPQPESHEALAA